MADVFVILDGEDTLCMYTCMYTKSPQCILKISYNFHFTDLNKAEIKKKKKTIFKKPSEYLFLD